MTDQYQNSFDDVDVSSVKEAIRRARGAGSPLGFAPEDAAIMLRRMDSFESRNSRRKDSGSERDARVRDLAKGLVDRCEADPKLVGSTIVDYEWLAAQVVDSVRFILPPGFSGAVGGAMLGGRALLDHAAERVHLAARQAQHKVVAIDDDATISFRSFELRRWDSVWVLVHRVVPVFALVREIPRIGQGHGIQNEIVDPPFDVGPLISADLRLLTAEQAALAVRDAHLVDASEADRRELRTFRAPTMGGALFNWWD